MYFFTRLVTWMKGTHDITNSPRSLKEVVNDYVRFTLKRATADDVGTYCILAKNVYGCDRAFFTVSHRQRARSEAPEDFDHASILKDIGTYTERIYLTGKNLIAIFSITRRSPLTTDCFIIYILVIHSLFSMSIFTSYFI